MCICTQIHSNVNKFGVFSMSICMPEVSNLHKTHPDYFHKGLPQPFLYLHIWWNMYLNKISAYV